MFIGVVTGALYGMRHALEPDHLAAVSTLVTQRRSVWRSILLGAFWGLGHTTSLLLVGVALLVVRAELPANVSDVFEICVAAMLVVLGVRAIRLATRGEVPAGGSHTHGGHHHSHEAGADHIHLGTWTLGRRPFLIGTVHGLAGSGALTALVFSALPTTNARLVYIILFGLGSAAGMALLTGGAGLSISRLAMHQQIVRKVSLATGAVSLLLGVYWGCAAAWSLHG